MKKLYGILSGVSIVLSIVSCVLCIITISIVLGNTSVVQIQDGAPQSGTHGGDFEYDHGSAEIIVRDIETVVPENGTDWHFVFPLRNETGSTLMLQAILVRDYFGGINGQMLGEIIIGADRFPEIMISPDGGALVLEPDAESFWEDWHPVVSDFDARSYIFVFINESGQQVSVEYPFELKSDGAVNTIDYSTDPGRDLFTLRYDADFCVDVADDVQWVPAKTLGDSDFSNAQISEMLGLSPEDKQTQIDTLYEAMQLYQIGGFVASDDNVRIQEDGINWEHHKPGFDAVRTNNGCCATSANWLCYILRNDYEEVGYMATSQRDGNGHIFNYIKHDGWYYIIDMTHYRIDWIATAPETGNLDDYYKTDFIAGNIHRVRDIQSYVNYVQAKYNDPPGLMFMYTAENCLALDSVREQNGITIIYEKNDNVKLNVIFDDPSDNLYVDYAAPPANLPDWSRA